MAKNDRILAIDIGATSIRLCEFEMNESGIIMMLTFAHREYEEELSETTRMEVVAGVLRQMLDENGVKAKRTILSMSGQSALLRFGKIPAMKYNRKQIGQLAKFEAQRNIPFEINEVIWDYQLIVEPNSDFIDVMSIVIKNDIVEQVTTAVRTVGLDTMLVDAAPIACYNAARANGLGKDECVMLVNIGGRSSNLIFLENDRFYARSIPIAGYSITQQIAKEFGIGQPEAEELKRLHGFVALGGAYAEPISETAAAVSKIIRNVMARLHGEISRSINIYRSQQGGGLPVKMYLTGGSSILTYCDVFFSEKLGIPVEYFNPFQAVELDDRIDKTALSQVAHMFSEPIGLAFRYFASCPVEINLLPKSMRRQQDLDVKKPYLVFALVVIAIIVFAIFIGMRTVTQDAQIRADLLTKQRNTFEPAFNDINTALEEVTAAREKESELTRFLFGKSVWPTIIEEIFRAKPSNVWIDTLQPVIGRIDPYDPMFGIVGNTRDSYDGGSFAIKFDDSTEVGEALIGGKMMVIDGLVLVCSTIYDFENTEENLKQYPAGQRGEFPMVFSEQGADEEEYGEEEEEEEDEEFLDEEEVEEEEIQEEGVMQGRVYPQDAFIRNLKQSPLFNGNAGLTMVTRVENIQEIPNTQGVCFEIQLKFVYPLQVISWKYSTTKSNISTESDEDDD